MKRSIVGIKAYVFALKIIPIYKKMTGQKEFIISKQLLRCSTSIGANIEEANAGFSKRDFSSKMSIASKEARETLYWLRLISDSRITSGIDFGELIKDVEELIRMLTKIVKTTQLENK